MKDGSWHPRRLRSDHRIMRHGLEGLSLVRAMYDDCDSWGRLPYSIEIVAGSAWVDIDVAGAMLEAMAKARVFYLYEAEGSRWAQIDRYDTDARGSWLRDRPAPMYPAPPDEIFAAARCSLVSQKNRKSQGKGGDSQEDPEDMPDPGDSGFYPDSPGKGGDTGIPRLSSPLVSSPLPGPSDPHTTRAREVAPLPGPAGPEPVAEAESGLSALPAVLVGPLKALLDARARCLVAASSRGGTPPYMPGSPAAEKPWTSQWDGPGRTVAALVGDYLAEDLATACTTMVAERKQLTSANGTFRKWFCAKADQARDAAAAGQVLGAPEKAPGTAMDRDDPESIGTPGVKCKANGTGKWEPRDSKGRHPDSRMYWLEESELGYRT